MSKGSKRRPTLISKEEEDLRWKLALGTISKEDFNKHIAELYEKEKAKMYLQRRIF